MEQQASQQFCEYIKGLRKERKLTIRAVTAKAGINDGELTRLESGKCNPRPETLKALAAALGVPLTDLFVKADYIGPYDLPTMAPYFRARYGHLPEETLDAVNDYLAKLIEEHGFDPKGPLALEDEAS